MSIEKFSLEKVLSVHRWTNTLFGFISSPEGDVFFHISDFPADSGEPKRNERVKFNVVENGDRYKAIKIERVEDNSTKAKKSKVASHNKSITTDLLSNFRR